MPIKLKYFEKYDNLPSWLRHRSSRRPPTKLVMEHPILCGIEEHTARSLANDVHDQVLAYARAEGFEDLEIVFTQEALPRLIEEAAARHSEELHAEISEARKAFEATLPKAA
jgi:hypothetical protein